MALEIERKFLVRSDGWKQQAVRQRTLRQAYLSKSHALSMRVRIEGNESATLTIKAAKQGFGYRCSNKGNGLAAATFVGRKVAALGKFKVFNLVVVV